MKFFDNLFGFEEDEKTKKVKGKDTVELPKKKTPEEIADEICKKIAREMLKSNDKYFHLHVGKMFVPLPNYIFKVSIHDIGYKKFNYEITSMCTPLEISRKIVTYSNGLCTMKDNGYDCYEISFIEEYREEITRRIHARLEQDDKERRERKNAEFKKRIQEVQPIVERFKQNKDLYDWCIRKITLSPPQWIDVYASKVKYGNGKRYESYRISEIIFKEKGYEDLTREQVLALALLLKEASDVGYAIGEDGETYEEPAYRVGLRICVTEENKTLKKW